MFKTFKKRILRNDSGNVAIEFAIVTPLLLLLLLGSFELCTYILAHNKVGRVTASIGDMASRNNSHGSESIDGILAAAPIIAEPFDFKKYGQIIVTSVVQEGGSPRIEWQKTGSKTLNAESQIGVSGGKASLPNGFSLANGEHAIIAEGFFDYIPSFGDSILPSILISDLSVYKVRK